MDDDSHIRIDKIAKLEVQLTSRNESLILAEQRIRELEKRIKELIKAHNMNVRPENQIKE